MDKLPFTGEELQLFTPELCLIGAIVALLLLPFFVGRSATYVLATLALAGVGCALIAALIWTNRFSEVSGTMMGGMLLVDPFSLFFKVFLLSFVALIIILWMTSAAESEQNSPEFLMLLLGATLGMALMVSTNNLLMMVLATEMASLPSYVMAGFRKNSVKGSEASLKYVVFGSAAAAIMVYGISLLYGLFGTLDLPTLTSAAAQLDLTKSPALIVALLMVMLGLAFKISAVPAHFWCPDVFEGAQVEVSAFLSVASKAAGLGLLLRIIVSMATVNDGSALALDGRAVAVFLGIIAAATATVGNLAAYFQNSLRRLLAYSSIAHAGYMLMVAAIMFDSENSGLAAIAYYLVVYLFMNLVAFGVTAYVYRQTGDDMLEQFAGLGFRAPLLGVVMMIALFSLVGLPPFGGFFGKYMIFVELYQAGVRAALPFHLGWTLLIVAAFNTLLSLFYYMRIARAMYFSDGRTSTPISAPLGGKALLVVAAGVLIVIGIFWDPFMDLVGNYAHFANSADLVAHK